MSIYTGSNSKINDSEDDGVIMLVVVVMVVMINKMILVMKMLMTLAPFPESLPP